MTALAGPTVPSPGPHLSDEQLAGWRDAVAHGRLPDPVRGRWQILRAGVIGLWEFDVAEYVFADGRAQFVGANQSGKSTLMTLTTLIMLAGNLERQNIDTFGDSGKDFRYYVEPSGNDQDRRDDSATAHRGWAWVEYGRIRDDGASEFFTTLLYAQAKRGVSQLTRTWMICHGIARVRAGLDLVSGQAVTEPKHLDGIDGVQVFPTGTHYRRKLTTALFGFTDEDRYATVLELLKTLRTPHLGQKLNPDWFTNQIRSALPPLARDEIEGLASGWQQVEQVGADRTDAEEARSAIVDYVAKAWRPWADAVLRQHADALTEADAALKAASTEMDAAAARLDQARQEFDAEKKKTQQLTGAVERNRGAHRQLLESAAYKSATGRAEAATFARRTANQAASRAEEAAKALVKLRILHEQALADQIEAQADLETARTAYQAAVAATVAAAGTAMLGDQAGQWAADADTARLEAAVAARRTALATLRNLLREANRLAATYRAAADLASDSEADLNRRNADAESAAGTLNDAIQQLSDDVERWAAALTGPAPELALRQRWLERVTTESIGASPRQVLQQLLVRDWLTPAVDPRTTRVAQLRAEADQQQSAAIAAGREASELAMQGDPIPPPPAGWTRRLRPRFPSAHGAPLWRLVDPADGIERDVLDQVEAALTAAGLLDAWVTVDGAYTAGRDGTDMVATSLPAATGPALSTVLVPAGDSGPLTATVTAILAGIGFTPAGQPHANAVAVAVDGRWQTPTSAGQAGPAQHGAELIGAAARAAARQRRITELHELAEQHRTSADDATEAADALVDEIAALRAAAEQAPSDGDVVAAALALTAANRERDTAQRKHVSLARKAEAARQVWETATADATTHALEHRLPNSDQHLEAVNDALNHAADAIGKLRLAVQGSLTSERAGAEAESKVIESEAHLDAGVEVEQAAAAEAALRDEQATEAEKAIALGDQELFDRAAELDRDASALESAIADSHRDGLALAGTAATAQSDWELRCRERSTADQNRSAAANSWWIPVDSGLAAARNLPELSGRTIDDALQQASTAIADLRPPSWPATANGREDRVRQVTARLFAAPYTELQASLEAKGGRAVHAAEADDARPLPEITMVVEASGKQLTPAAAIAHLDDQIAKLSATHDEKLHQMYTQILSSTFINHLRDRLKRVLSLLNTVNDVLQRHPTGANRTTLRLRRHPRNEQQSGYKILRALESGTFESDAAQEQLQAFLIDRLQQVQEAGLPGVDDWTDRLATLLDYRDWFDVVCEFRVGTATDPKWKPLTKQVHAVDSGGGKVVTLMQPLLATLVALYSDNPAGPRPLWLDEAFEGVDPNNRAIMLRMLCDFDLDFLLAGPGALVAAAQVPAAAIWTITRAPAPLPGVDLSLMLWAGNAMQIVPVADTAAPLLAIPRPTGQDGPDLLSTLTADAGALGSKDMR
ncbi:SbcC/MukB-like Walker B domain-containing protein [Micromonospora sp. WMMA1976]|uniref:SbcC/MukB-like Walker B domain-containing protein n=1 Tax=Micromonospora sp. WMMA1976 TaxID=3014995 RepID=UPI00248C0559|nr:SbcC/MukB-like Walker B domain-containing protein [Micromonospora sp. WMMA1976]WBC05311.1 SbcC/MukB-like Walker B domain-containing protein [Micromonospora sp. WMMA1976]